MDLLVQNLKQEEVQAFQELAVSLGVSVVVVPENTKTGKISKALVMDSLSQEPIDINLDIPTDGAHLTHLTKKEPGGYYRLGSPCNSYHNPLNTHKRDHCDPTSEKGSSRHPSKSGRRDTEDPNSGFDFDI